MNTEPSQQQNDPSTKRTLKILEELRRQLRDTELWPESGNNLLSDLAHLATSPHSQTITDEDYDMLSIVVNDALIGIDIMKKYPAFYARMLVDEELRTAFLDTLEMLEAGEEEIPDYPEVTLVNLDFIRKVMSRPIVVSVTQDKLELVWKRTAEQLQTMFYINSLKPRKVFRSDDYLPGGGQLNILNSQVQVGDQEVALSFDAHHAIDNPGYLDLTIVMELPGEFPHHLEATVVWGDYSETAVVSQYGIATFPPLKTDEIIAPNGDLMHGLELHLEQVE